MRKLFFSILGVALAALSGFTAWNGAGEVVYGGLAILGFVCIIAPSLKHDGKQGLTFSPVDWHIAGWTILVGVGLTLMPENVVTIFISDFGFGVGAILLITLFVRRFGFLK